VGSPFDILGVDPDADDAEVVEAYRQRVLEAHPDHGGSASEFRAVQSAYEQILSGGGGEGGDEDRDDGSGSVEEREDDREDARVEYLNYEVLDDHGWELDDEDLFENASAAGLDPVDYGRLLVRPDESLLEAAENRGFAWPFACRGGACANCAVAVFEGELSQPVDHILPQRLVDRGFRLSCNGMPVTDEMKVVYNVKHLAVLDELRLPPHPFERAYSSD